jgi:gluconolactonase
MKINELIERGDPERLASGFEFTEGPVWLAEGALLFSDIPGNKIYRWTEQDGAKVWREPTGNSNGLTLDRDGRLIACEHTTRRVTRTEKDGSLTVLAASYQGKRLTSPNDVVVKSDGSVYFTDPPYGIEPHQKEQPCNGVYRLAPDGELHLLFDDFERPNGLAFSPDESVLYIDDSYKRHVRAFNVSPDGSLDGGSILADMDHPQPGSPDGMKVDEAGNLFVTGATGVWVFEPGGALLGIIAPPERPANIAWGDADRKTLYVTARTSLYRFRVKIPGVPVF